MDSRGVDRHPGPGFAPPCQVSARGIAAHRLGAGRSGHATQDRAAQFAKESRVASSSTTSGHIRELFDQSLSGSNQYGTKV